jgi:hypothetical protein
MQLYTQEFYETVVKRKLAPGGVFVTQSGPAGVLSATQVHPVYEGPMCKWLQHLQMTACIRYSASRRLPAAVVFAGIHSNQSHIAVGVPRCRPFPAASAFLRRLLGEHHFVRTVTCASNMQGRGDVLEHDMIFALLCAMAGVEHGIYRRVAESADSWGD